MIFVLVHRILSLLMSALLLEIFYTTTSRGYRLLLLIKKNKLIHTHYSATP